MMIITPFYEIPTQEGSHRHCETVAEAVRTLGRPAGPTRIPIGQVSEKEKGGNKSCLERSRVNIVRQYIRRLPCLV